MRSTCNASVAIAADALCSPCRLHVPTWQLRLPHSRVVEGPVVLGPPCRPLPLPRPCWVPSVLPTRLLARATECVAPAKAKCCRNQLCSGIMMVI